MTAALWPDGPLTQSPAELELVEMASFQIVADRSGRHRRHLGQAGTTQDAGDAIAVWQAAMGGWSVHAMAATRRRWITPPNVETPAGDEPAGGKENTCST